MATSVNSQTASSDETIPPAGPGRMANILATATAALLVLVYTALIWRAHIEQLGPDAVDYASVARNLAEGHGYRLDLIPFHPGLLPTVSHLPEWHGLLRPFELAPLFYFFGPDAALVNAPSLFYSAGAALLAFVLARRFAGPCSGLLATLIVLMRSDLMLAGALAADDSGSAFWTLLTILLALRVPSSGSLRWAVLAGLSAAIGTLEKFTGVVLPFAIIAALLVRGQTRRAVQPWKYLALVGPACGAAGLYLLRNYLAWGAFDFRFSALEWLGKFDMSRYFAYYPTRPTVDSVWADIGVPGILRGIGRELGILGAMALENWPVMVPGPLALVALTRSEPFLALTGLFYGGALLSSILVGHQFEPRYILAFVCIEIVALAAVFTNGAVSWLERFPTHIARLAKVATVLAIATFNLTVPTQAFSYLGGVIRNDPSIERGPGLLCDEAYEFIRLHVDPNDPIVSPDPWLVAWQLRRKAVMAPTNGPDALEAVVRHYRTRWALVGPYAGGGDLRSDLARLRERGSSLRPLLVADSRDCKLYWLSL